MYLPLLAGGESMGEKWFGLLSDRRAHTQWHSERAAAYGSWLDRDWGRGTSPNPVTTPSPPPRKAKKEVCIYTIKTGLDSPLFSWTLTPLRALHASSSSNEGWHQRQQNSRDWWTGDPPRLIKSTPRAWTRHNLQKCLHLDLARPREFPEWSHKAGLQNPLSSWEYLYRS